MKYEIQFSNSCLGMNPTNLPVRSELNKTRRNMPRA
nr:MAG TPA: hypothetical protein [Caudoviricetes sp.]